MSSVVLIVHDIPAGAGLRAMAPAASANQISSSFGSTVGRRSM